MNDPNHDPQARLRQAVYLILIAVGSGAVLGRILAVDSVDRVGLQKDRIQTALNRKKETLREKGLEGERFEKALKREETRLHKLLRLRRPFLSANDRSRWCTVRALVERQMRVEQAPYSIDKVLDQPGWDTIDKVKHHGHFYSSKPPLLPTLMAAEYWVIHRLSGATLGTHPYEIGRFMVIIVNLVPLVVYFLLLGRLVERLGTTDWGRVFVMGAAVFGTFLTTFAVVINNHLPAAVSALIALYAAIRIWFDGQRSLRYFVIAGLFAAFTAANELPALTLLVPLALALLWKAPRQTVLGFLPAAVLVAAGFFGTNWIAHRSLRPPYMHRSQENKEDNWYDYEGSYWNERVGIDRGEPSAAVYALHVLVGHHGLFSLTPVWLLSTAGLFIWLRRREDRQLRQLASLIGGVSVVCLVFYLSRGQCDRNYGGMTSGFRWMFWCAPLWLLAMLPAADVMARRRWARCVALVLLGMSVLSASYPTWNPWTHPWIMDWLSYVGWIQ